MTTNKQIEQEAHRRWVTSKGDRSLGSYIIELVRENWTLKNPALVAARDYLRVRSSPSIAHDIYVGQHDQNLVLKAFVAGAAWQKGQVND